MPSIAIIFLKEPLEFRKKLQKICLASLLVVVGVGGGGGGMSWSELTKRVIMSISFLKDTGSLRSIAHPLGNTFQYLLTTCSSLRIEVPAAGSYHSPL